MDGFFNRGSLPALEAIVRFTAARHKAIAANIAHSETAGYKAVDLPVGGFEKALSRAFAEQRTSPRGEFRMKPPEIRTEEAKDAGVLRPSGNTVDLEVEMGKMVKNGALHNLAAALLAHQFSLLRCAVAGKVMG